MEEQGFFLVGGLGVGRAEGLGVTPLPPPHGSAAPHPLPQIFNDALSDTCIRISQEERLHLKSLFGNPRLHPHILLLPSWGGAHPRGTQTLGSYTQPLWYPILISWAYPSHKRICL